jgi:long-chain fatty acid transport protein
MIRPCNPMALVALSGALSFASAPALAINGAQPGGFGVKNAAMGGAAIALPLDAEAAANNPAGMAVVPRSFTLGLAVFKGESSADYFLPGNRLENRTTLAVPTGGINWPLSESLSVGLTLAAQGVGADYEQPALPVPGAGNAKSSLKVAEFIPTLAWKASPELALGASLNAVAQRFEASGVIVPAPVPGGFLPLPGHGSQGARGVGIRLGALWNPTPDLRLGVNFKSRTRMSSLEGYANDLLAYSDGRIDVPAQYGVGMAWNVGHGVTLAADWLRIEYSGLKVMQDPQGFGWKDQPVLRLGGSWAIDDAFSLRAGYSRNSNQIVPSCLAQSLLVPSLFDRAYTAGLSWRASKASELNLALEVNPRRTVAGTDGSTGVNLSAKAYFLMLGYQHSFD